MRSRHPETSRLRPTAWVSAGILVDVAAEDGGPRGVPVKELVVVAAAVALVLGAPGLSGQQPAALPDGPRAQQQQSQIPDAPKPQINGLAPVAPGKGTTPLSNGDSGSSPSPTPDDGFQKPVGATLPGSEKIPDDGQEEAPVTPANSQEFLNDPGTYKLNLRVNSVEVPFTVKDRKGQLVPGLTWRDVHVYENNVRQHITVFTVDPYPLSVAVVIDQSLPFDVMSRVNSALGALTGAFTPYDEVAVFTYNNGPRMLTEFTGGQSPRLSMAIDRAKAVGREPVFYDASGPMSGGIHLNGGAEDHENPLASGGPGSPQGLSQQQVPREPHTLNDAILMAAQSTTKAAKGRRRIVYIISDGKEFGSKAKQKDVIKYLQTNNVEVVATLVGDASVTGAGFIDTLHLPLMMRDNVLPVFTKATGGEFYADYRSKGIATSFARITEEARTQYTVWFNSREPMLDSKFRKTEVRVLKPNLQVIAKDGYYPSATAVQPPTRPQRVSTASPSPQP
jgi:VWFA-related protein